MGLQEFTYAYNIDMLYTELQYKVIYTNVHSRNHSNSLQLLFM